MRSPKKKIKLEIKRYQSLIKEFEENENVSHIALKSTTMHTFLGEVMSLDTVECLNGLIERNDFIELLMPYRFTSPIEEYLLEELPFPFPTLGYKERFIKIAQNIEENINEINLLKKLNKNNEYLNTVNESLVIILVDEAKTDEENPKELFKLLMKKYSLLYNENKYILK